jgi:hypothetical protein
MVEQVVKVPDLLIDEDVISGDQVLKQVEMEDRATQMTKREFRLGHTN